MSDVESEMNEVKSAEELGHARGVFLSRASSRSGGSAAGRGFTLIELMIVVVIMGILATLAIYSIRGYIDYTKTNEARDMIGDIMAGQEAYFGETATYLDISEGLADADFYPEDDFNGQIKYQWGGTGGCGAGCRDRFKAIGVWSPDAVRFRYVSTTQAAGDAPDFGSYAEDCKGDVDEWPRASFVVVAVSDLNNDGDAMSVIAGSAEQTDLCAFNLGQ